MEDFIRMLPIYAFSLLFVFKLIYSHSFKSFINWGRIRNFGWFEVIDLVFLIVSAFIVIVYSFRSNFDGTFFEWAQVIVSGLILYRFFYLGCSRLFIKNETVILDDESHHRFFK